MGETVYNLFNSAFSDVDTSSSMSGVAIMENVADITLEGVWQYTIDGGSNWSDVGTVSNSSALVMGVDASSMLRFVPVANFSGTPNSLGVRFLDNTYSFGVGSGKKCWYK